MPRITNEKKEIENKLLGIRKNCGLPARKSIKQFLHKIALGQPKITAFKETFPCSEDWSICKLYSHINRILMADSSRLMLKEYRDKMVDLFDQKKIDMIAFLEEKIFIDKSIPFQEKLKAIDSYTKLMDSFDKKNINVLQQINISNNEEKKDKIDDIFGIKFENEEDAEVKNEE